jgi:hypothetical protein
MVRASLHACQRFELNTRAPRRLEFGVALRQLRSATTRVDAIGRCCVERPDMQRRASSKQLAKLMSTAAVFATFVLLPAANASAAASAGALVGEGFTEGFDLGVGARAGYSFDAKVYVGGTFVYHFGRQAYLDSRLRITYFGAEGGYDFAAAPLTIRPYLGLGISVMKLYEPSYQAAVWPGVAVLVPLQPLFVGADARFVTSLHRTLGNIVGDAFSVFATGGVTF